MTALISDEYKQQLAALHATGKFGVAARWFGPHVRLLLEDTNCNEVLDYGAGSNRTLEAYLPVGCAYYPYDPAVPGMDEDPEPRAIVVCIDVLEHIEPDRLDAVLQHLRSKIEVAALISFATGPAQKVLPDGRNAHLIQQPLEWWVPKLAALGELMDLKKSPTGWSLRLFPS